MTSSRVGREEQDFEGTAVLCAKRITSEKVRERLDENEGQSYQTPHVMSHFSIVHMLWLPSKRTPNTEPNAEVQEFFLHYPSHMADATLL